ncbi:MAG: cytochrome C [Geobacteraceae bacterium]|nr:cytochrome C [Geobacteraceae bacterium]NTW79829.1 cytochrome C [Geobacteraceae bacterium]
MIKHLTVIISLLFFAPSVSFPGGEQFPNGFHNGGIGPCEGCHSKTQKVPESGSAITAAKDTLSSDAGRGMLNGQDPGSTCLICHTAPKGQKQPSGYFVATCNEDLAAGLSPGQMTPGGDFGWLRKSYHWATLDAGKIKDGESPGERHGHNIVASQFSYNPDSSNVTAPGGVFPSGKLTCTSCHDPHGGYRMLSDGSFSTNSAIPAIASGSYKSSPLPDTAHAIGSYRLLAGKGYSPSISDSSVVFTSDPPTAVAPDKYNRAESKHRDTRVAYGSDMSEWCQNCHKPHKHPTGNAAKITPSKSKEYNSYIASGDISGLRSSSYSSLVPFEVGTKDYMELKRLAGNGGEGGDMSGPLAGENIICLTCHRAHAGGWDSITRWNTKADLIVYDGKFPGIDSGAPTYIAQGRTSAETRKAYYDRPADSFAVFQRGLCSKCHAKD